MSDGPPDAAEKCRTCGNSRLWHNHNNPVHPFNAGGAGVTAFLGKRGNRTPQSDPRTSQRGVQGPPRPVWPTDPVLRIALINAGVITMDDLQQAEALLQTSMGIGGQTHGQSTEKAWRGEVQVGETAPMDVGERRLRSQEVGTQPNDQQT